MEESLRTRPLFGRWMALKLRPTRPLTFIGPAWAALCGAIASGGLTLRGQSVLFFILSLLLCDTVLGGWRVQWAESEWRRRVRRPGKTADATPKHGRRRALLRAVGKDPAEEDSAGLDPRVVRTAQWVLRQIARGRDLMLLFFNIEFAPIAIAGVLALSIAAVLGLTTVILVVVAMALALIESELRLGLSAWLRAFGEITLSWLIAQSAFGLFSWLSLGVALLFTLVYRALLGLAMGRNGRWVLLGNLAQVVVAIFLIAADAGIGAGIVLLALLAQILWQARYNADHDGAYYARQVQTYVLVTMIIAAFALWF